MKRILAAIAALAIYCHPASAEWSLTDMNRLIEATNFKVGSGCSGTLISVERKLILTNHHCVTDELKIVEVDEIADDGTVRKIKRQIRLPTEVSQPVIDDFGLTIGRNTRLVEIIRVDPNFDLALLKVRGPLWTSISAPILPTGRTVTRGERVYMVGNPAGLEATVIEGIVSHVRREVREFTSPLGKPWEGMQISGGIWGGNSGGAVFNAGGFLIGVPTLGHVRATHLGLAVPVDLVREFLARACHADLFGGANPASCK